MYVIELLSFLFTGKLHFAKFVKNWRLTGGRARKKEVAMHHTDCNMHGTQAMLLNSGVWPAALPEIMR